MPTWTLHHQSPVQGSSTKCSKCSPLCLYRCWASHTKWGLRRGSLRRSIAKSQSGRKCTSNSSCCFQWSTVITSFSNYLTCNLNSQFASAEKSNGIIYWCHHFGCTLPGLTHITMRFKSQFCLTLGNSSYKGEVFVCLVFVEGCLMCNFWELEVLECLEGMPRLWVVGINRLIRWLMLGAIECREGVDGWGTATFRVKFSFEGVGLDAGRWRTWGWEMWCNVIQTTRNRACHAGIGNGAYYENIMNGYYVWRHIKADTYADRNRQRCSSQHQLQRPLVGEYPDRDQEVHRRVPHLAAALAQCQRPQSPLMWQQRYPDQDHGVHGGALQLAAALVQCQRPSGCALCICAMSLWSVLEMTAIKCSK